MRENEHRTPGIGFCKTAFDLETRAGHVILNDSQADDEHLMSIKVNQCPAVEQ